MSETRFTLLPRPVRASVQALAWACAGVAVLASTTGCGNSLRTHLETVSLSSIQLASGTVDTGAPGLSSMSGYTCPDSNNIVPDYDYQLDGSGYFKACVPTNSSSATANSQVGITGKPIGSPTFCAFPAQVIDSEHIVAKPDLQTGLPMYQCTDMTPNGVAFNFTQISYNAFFIVQASDRNQMQICLAESNYYLCPHYSFGRFRN